MSSRLLKQIFKPFFPYLALPVAPAVADEDLAVCRDALWSGSQHIRALLEHRVVAQVAVAAGVVGEAHCARICLLAVDAVAAVRYLLSRLVFKCFSLCFAFCAVC